MNGGGAGFETEDNFPTVLEIAMGDDGTGHCAQCGITIDRFNPDCATCLLALDVLDSEEGVP